MKTINKVLVGMATGALTLGATALTMGAVSKKANKELEELSKKEILDEESNKRIEKLENRVDKLNKLAIALGGAGIGIALAGAGMVVGSEIPNDKNETERMEDVEAIEPITKEIELELDGTLTI